MTCTHKYHYKMCYSIYTLAIDIIENISKSSHNFSHKIQKIYKICYLSFKLLVILALIKINILIFDHQFLNKFNNITIIFLDGKLTKTHLHLRGILFQCTKLMHSFYIRPSKHWHVHVQLLLMRVQLNNKIL